MTPKKLVIGLVVVTSSFLNAEMTGPGMVGPAMAGLVAPGTVFNGAPAPYVPGSNPGPIFNPPMGPIVPTLPVGPILANPLPPYIPPTPPPPANPPAPFPITISPTGNNRTGNPTGVTFGFQPTPQIATSCTVVEGPDVDLDFSISDLFTVVGNPVGVNANFNPTSLLNLGVVWGSPSSGYSVTSNYKTLDQTFVTTAAGKVVTQMGQLDIGSNFYSPLQGQISGNVTGGLSYSYIETDAVNGCVRVEGSIGIDEEVSVTVGNNCSIGPITVIINGVPTGVPSAGCHLQFDSLKFKDRQRGAITTALNSLFNGF